MRTEMKKGTSKRESINNLQRKGNRRMMYKTDMATLCMEALISVVGAMGILAMCAFATGSHIVEWHGGCTGIAFVLLSFGIWGSVELSGRKKQMCA